MSDRASDRRRGRLVCAVAGVAAVAGVMGVVSDASAVPRSWDDAGGSVSKLWSDFGNWSPDGAVGIDDIFIGNLADAAGDRTIADANYSIASLTITNGAAVIQSTDGGSLLANSRELIVNGATTVSGAGSEILVFGRNGGDGFDTDTLTLNSGAAFTLNSTTGLGQAVLEVDSGPMTINTGGVFRGTGRLDLEHAPASATSLLINDGTIEAFTASPLIFAPPAAGTLQLTASSANARFDWDGPSGNGIINVGGNQTLDVDISTGTDAFSGTMNLSTGSTLDMRDAWALDSGTINVKTPAFGLILPGQDPSPGAPARITGALWNMTGGEVNIDDAWDTLQSDSVWVATGGTINNSGKIIFNAPATFSSAVDFNMNGNGASMDVHANVTINTPDFNFDGNEAVTNITNINGHTLTLNLGAGADDFFGHTINLNSGSLVVTTLDDNWELNSFSTTNATGASQLGGESLRVNGVINVSGAGSILTVTTNTIFDSAASINVAADTRMTVANTNTYLGGGSYTGAGIFDPGQNVTIFSGTVNWNFGIVNLDKDGSATINVNNGATLAIAANSIDDFGDGFDGTLNIANTGTLRVSLAGGADFEVEQTGSINYTGDLTDNTFILPSTTGSALRLTENGQLNVAGLGTSGERVKVNGGIVNIAAAGRLTLDAGDHTPGNTNEIAGGVINGPGELRVGTGRMLRGFGTINSQINGQGSSRLVADGGTLLINGLLNGMNAIGADATGTLEFANPWDAVVVNRVELEGGTLAGATVTNNALGGIQGFGRVTATIINNTILIADRPGTLLIESLGSDWDGTTETGRLRATQGTLELRGAGGVFAFDGIVQADGGTVFTNGFALRFEPASELRITTGSFRSTHDTRLFGTLTTFGSPLSTIEVNGTFTFDNGSSTSLANNLLLKNTFTTVNAGATFAGAGGMINPLGSTFVPRNASNMNVGLLNSGDLAIELAATGRADVRDFEQTANGTMLVDIDGPLLSQFDRLFVNGNAVVDGTLSLDVDYNPAYGTVHTILSAVGGVTGIFDTVGGLEVSPTKYMAVIYTTNNIRVIAALPGDADLDTDVDFNDLLVLAQNFNASGKSWATADFTGDGASLFDDLLLVAQNFGTTLLADGTIGALEGVGDFDIAWQLARSVVPEPTTLGLVAAGSLLALRRRR